MFASLANIWGGKKVTPESLVTSLRNSLDSVTKESSEKNRNEVSKNVQAIKVMLFGDSNGEAKPQEIEALVRLSIESDFLKLLSCHLAHMEFETRKDSVQIFNNLFRRGGEEAIAFSSVLPTETPDDGDGKTPGSSTTVEKIPKSAVDVVIYSDVIIGALIGGYDNNEIALNCGSMLRESIKNERVTKALLDSNKLWKFFELVEVNDFDVASDAFTTFKDILTRHQTIVAAFIEENYDKFVSQYNLLLASKNYVTRRQSLKLLGELIVNRTNFYMMTKYISSENNLKLIMNLLLDNRKNIQFEAFHVFKIFAANPNKTVPVKKIFVKNKDKLLAYMSDFLIDRDDEQFQEDKQIVINEIEQM